MRLWRAPLAGPMSSFNNAAMAYFNWLEGISNKGLYGNPPGEAHLTLPVTVGAWLFLNARIGAVANPSRSQKPARLDPWTCRCRR